MFSVNGIVEGVLHRVWLLSLSIVFSGFASYFCTWCIFYVGVFTEKASVFLGVPSVTICALSAVSCCQADGLGDRLFSATSKRKEVCTA